MELKDFEIMARWQQQSRLVLTVSISVLRN